MSIYESYFILEKKYVAFHHHSSLRDHMSVIPSPIEKKPQFAMKTRLLVDSYVASNYGLCVLSRTSRITLSC